MKRHFFGVRESIIIKKRGEWGEKRGKKKEERRKERGRMED